MSRQRSVRSLRVPRSPESERRSESDALRTEGASNPPTQPVARGTQHSERGAASAPTVPLRRQYLTIKQRFPEAIVLFRLGDFYETFDEDAETLARTLDIVLTSREMGKGLRVPMAGIPHHAAEGYINRLVQAGYKVAVCDQVGEVPKRGLVERDVTRVVTPGTVTDETMLDARANNYLAAVVVEGSRAGVAHADITTGEFATTEITEDSPEETLLAVGRELLRLAPSELVLPGDGLTRWGDVIAPNAWLGEDFAAGRGVSQTDAWRWRDARTAEALRRHFAVDSLDGFGCAGKPLAVRAAGGLLQYLEDTQLSGLDQITALRTYRTDEFMTLDAQTRRNLELAESSRGDRRHSLIAVLDQTRTPMGARLLRRWVGQPLLDLDTLRQRQDGVAAGVADGPSRAALREACADVGDLERLTNRALTGIATPKDLVTLRASLRALPSIAAAIQALDGHPPDGSGAGVSSASVQSLTGCQDVLALLERAIADEPAGTLGKGAVLRLGYAPELDEHRERAREARDFIANLERAERERTGIRSLKVGYNKVFGYYLEISTAALASAERDAARRNRGAVVSGAQHRDADERDARVLPSEYIAKQTLANATRYFTPRLKEHETVVLTAEETLAELEADAFRRVVSQVGATASRLIAAARVIAERDVLAALAEVAVARMFIRPRLDDGTTIEIRQGRHPVIEAVLPAGEYVPNDVTLDAEGAAGAQVVILTGPNMAGKSSYLRQAALICLMAQIGSFVPAAEARIGVVDRIFTRIGAQDDIATGQSTFMVEMLETANILHHATKRSLVVLDEIGRGTSTYDGLAIARAIVEYVHNAPRLGSRTLFATHYHELTELERILPRVRAARMDVLEDGERIVFLRQVVPGGADKSYGVHVAQLAGIPRAVVRRAEEILADLEGVSADRLERGGPEADGAGVGVADAASPSRNRAGRRAAMRLPAPAGTDAIDGTFQLTFFGAPNPALDALKALDVEALTPIEALTKLYELQRLASGVDA